MYRDCKTERLIKIDEQADRLSWAQGVERKLLRMVAWPWAKEVYTVSTNTFRESTGVLSVRVLSVRVADILGCTKSTSISSEYVHV
jgi:hypothetical protein